MISASAAQRGARTTLALKRLTTTRCLWCGPAWREVAYGRHGQPQTACDETTNRRLGRIRFRSANSTRSWEGRMHRTPGNAKACHLAWAGRAIRQCACERLLRPWHRRPRAPATPKVNSLPCRPPETSCGQRTRCLAPPRSGAGGRSTPRSHTHEVASLWARHASVVVALARGAMTAIGQEGSTNAGPCRLWHQRTQSGWFFLFCMWQARDLCKARCCAPPPPLQSCAKRLHRRSSW